MSATAKATNRPAWQNKPAWDITKSRIRRMAAEQGHDPEALALHYFDTELDNLLEWQASQIESELAQVEREELKRRELASGQAGFCFECGVKLRGTSSQCGSCKEGIGPTPVTFDHSITIHRHRR
jgi:hypothetical protein